VAKAVEGDARTQHSKKRCLLVATRSAYASVSCSIQEDQFAIRRTPATTITTTYTIEETHQHLLEAVARSG